MAAIAWAPPTLKTVSMPHSSRGDQDRRVHRAIRARGVHSTRCEQPAMPRRDAEHDHRRGQRGRAGGHIESDGGDGPQDLLAAHARLGLERSAADAAAPRESARRWRSRARALRSARASARRRASANSLRRHRERLKAHAVEALGVARQRRIALAPHALDDPGGDARGLAHGAAMRAGERGAPSLRIPVMMRMALPVEDDASGFSSGEHLLDRQHQQALAPAFFRLSSVSQNTFSRHTAWTATRSCEPSSGMIVGDSEPGRSLRISRQGAIAARAA